VEEIKGKNLLQKATTTYRKDHEEAMKLPEECKVGHDYLVLARKKMWTRSHFITNSKCDLLCNNICESRKKCILEARDKPISLCLR